MSEKVSTPKPIVPHNPLALVNRVFRGRGNGVLAVTKVAPVMLHEHYNVVDVKERTIEEHEVPNELKKLEMLRAHFAPKLDDDAADVDPFTYIAADIISRAVQQLPEAKINAEAMLCRLFQAQLDQTQVHIDKAQQSIEELNRRVAILMSSTDGEKDERYRQEEALEKQIDGLRMGHRKTKNEHSDMKNLLERMIGYLQTHEKELAESEPPEPETARKETPGKHSVHVARSLSWTEILHAFAEGAAGCIFDSNAVGAISHPFIFGHARGMPMVTLPEPLKHLFAGCMVAIDSRTGEVFLNPNGVTIEALDRKGKGYGRLERLLREQSHVHQTLDGKPFPDLQLNIKDSDDFAHLKGQVAGLFRLEGLYLESRPNYLFLVRVMKQAMTTAKAVNFRLFDVAMDKLPGFFTPTDIEALRSTRGGIDFLLHTELGRSILHDQLKALLIAYDRLDHLEKVAGKTVRVILPMVSSPDEVHEFRQLFGKIEDELINGPLGARVSAKIGVGAMIETAAAVANLDHIMPLVDYVTVGGNDLTCDLLGFRERIKLMSGPKYDWLSPTVLQNDVRIIEVARKYSKLIGSCGEQSRDPMAAIMLTLMGIDSLSMDASYRPEINFVLRNIHLGEWGKFSDIDPDHLSVVERASRLPDALAVREFLYSLITTKAHADTRMTLSDVITQARPLTYEEAA